MIGFFPMGSRTALITGASRGIGLEFVRQYAADQWRVIAGCRAPESAAALSALAAASGGRVCVHRLDVEDLPGVDHLAAELAGIPIDVLVNNAGSAGAPTTSRDRAPEPFGMSNFDHWQSMFRVNVMGPMKVMEAFAPNLEAGTGRSVATISSQLGSMTLNTSGGGYAYRATKAGVNAVMRSLAIDLAGHGIRIAILHPGWVKTDMGGPQAPVEPVDSVRGMRAVIAGLTPERSGQFFLYDGSRLPW